MKILRLQGVILISYYTPLRQKLTTRPDRNNLSNDTRFLFSFYGAQPGTRNIMNRMKINYASVGIWHCKTMKIVVAVFPGDNKEDPKRTAVGQRKDTVKLRSSHCGSTGYFPHYNPPEPLKFLLCMQRWLTMVIK